MGPSSGAALKRLDEGAGFRGAWQEGNERAWGRNKGLAGLGEAGRGWSTRGGNSLWRRRRRRSRKSREISRGKGPVEQRAAGSFSRQKGRGLGAGAVDGEPFLAGLGSRPVWLLLYVSEFQRHCRVRRFEKEEKPASERA